MSVHRALLESAAFLTLACAVSCLPFSDYPMPLGLTNGGSIPGTPLLYDILDMETETVRDCTLSFWMHARKTKGDANRKNILFLGTPNTALKHRGYGVEFQTRNSYWHAKIESTMGYSSVDETWVHYGIVISNGTVTLYSNGYPTGAAPITNAFWDRNFGPSLNFVSIPGDLGDDIKLDLLLFELRSWSAPEMLDHAKKTAPPGAILHLTRVHEQGFGQVKFRNVFRKKFLFGAMPPPFSLPRLLFSKEDLPELRALYDANDKMRVHKVNAEFAIEHLMASRLDWLSSLPDSRDPTNAEADDIVALLFSALLIARDDAHGLLAQATMRIVRSKRQRLEEAAARNPVNVAWEHAGMEPLYHSHALALMVDLAGPSLKMSEIREALTILAIGARGRRALYTRSVTPEPFDVYSRRRQFKRMRFASNKDAWQGSALATIHILLHGHEGLHEPGDIYATYNVFRKHVRSQISPSGLSSESVSKTALWRGFLPWIMLARHRIPGLDECIWDADRLQKFATAKQAQIVPAAPIFLDHGTWAMSQPRSSWAAFYSFLDSPEDDKHNAWLARLVDPYVPLSPETARRLLKEQGTGLLESSTTNGTRLLFYDERFPVMPVYGPRGGIKAFRNSGRSCIVSEDPVANSAAQWKLRLSFRAVDGGTNGRLLSLYEEGDSELSVLTVRITDRGSFLEVVYRGHKLTRPITAGQWEKLVLIHRSGFLQMKGAEGSIPWDKGGRFYLLLGSFANLQRRLHANQHPSSAAIRRIQILEDGKILQFWARYPRWAFGRVLRSTPSLHSLFDSRHWSETLPAVSNPLRRRERNLFDDSIGYYYFSRSGSPSSTVVVVHSQDTSGGHVYKAGGHFDVFRAGTGWLFVENRFAAFADDYNTLLVDGKRAPGSNNAEQAVSTGGMVTKDGSWVSLDLKWFYRHAGMIHDPNGFRYDESAALEPEAVAVRTATRTVTNVNIGPRHRAVTVVMDRISMIDGGVHRYTWLGQVFRRHGVRWETNGTESVADIWLDGDAEYSFDALDERMHAPMSVLGLVTHEQYASRTAKDRRCLIRVLRACGAPSINVDVRNRYRFKRYGQTMPAEVYDEPNGDFDLRIAKQLRVEAQGIEADFVVAIYPMSVGEEMPDIRWNEQDEAVELSYNGDGRRVLRDGSIALS